MLKKIKMELAWHNCKTCPPEEAYNANLCVWDGDRVVQSEWYNHTWHFDDGWTLSDIKSEDAEHLWWADLNQAASAFFGEVE